MGHISTGDNLVSMKIMDKNWFLRSQYQDGDKQIGLLNYNYKPEERRVPSWKPKEKW